MKKLLSLLAVSALVGTSASSLQPLFTSNIRTNIKINTINKKKLNITDLFSVLTEKNLGKITISEVLPTVQQIKEKIKEKNVNVDINAITISEITTTNAKVTGDDVKYTGNLYVVYNSVNLLNSILTNKFLELIILNNNQENDLPTVQQIKEKIKEKNVNVDINAITISEITTTNAKVTGDDVKYTGNLYVVYQLSNFIKIAGTQGQITSLTTDTDGNIYAGTASDNGGKIYKSNNGTDFREMTGTQGQITSLTTDTDGNIYAGTANGKLYKGNKSTDFKEIFSLPNSLFSKIYNIIYDDYHNIYLGTLQGIYKKINNENKFIKINNTGNFFILIKDKDNNLYAIDHIGNIYKCLYGENIFNPISNDVPTPNCLAINTDGNIYAGSDNGKIYKSNNGTDFREMTGTQGQITSLTTDTDGNIYAGSNNGIVYKCLSKKTNFKSLLGIHKKITSLATDTDGNIYAGTSYFENIMYLGDVYKSAKL